MRKIAHFFGAWLFFLGILLLSACAPMQHKLSTILVPCQTPVVDKPAFPFDTTSADADIFTKVKNLLADRKVRQGYEGKLEASVESCRR